MMSPASAAGTPCALALGADAIPSSVAAHLLAQPGPVSGYVYDVVVATAQARRLRAALPSWATLLFAVKSNGYAPALRALLAKGGVDGLEVASAHEARLAASLLPVGAPGADADPYLALAGILLAFRHGIEERLELPPATIGAPAPDAVALPDNLPVAADLLEQSMVARKGLGDAVVDALVASARAEWTAYCSVVSEWERARGFERR